MLYVASLDCGTKYELRQWPREFASAPGEREISKAQEAGEIAASVEPAQLAFELDALGSAANHQFQLLHDRAVFDRATEQMHFRSKEEITKFFGGLEMVPPYQGAEPAICYTGVWGAEDPVLADSEGARWLYCGVARKP